MPAKDAESHLGLKILAMLVVNADKADFKRL